MKSVKKIFSDRKRKIIEFYQNSVKYEESGRIGDAIKYAYWATVLLNSHPYSSEIFVFNDNGNKIYLNTELGILLNNYFQNIDFEISKVSSEGDFKTLVLTIKYGNEFVSNLDYQYWDGMDWSTIYSAKDGTGLVELSGTSTSIENLKIKVEYEFLHESRIDKEVEMVIKGAKPIPFPKAYKNISFVKKPIKEREEPKKKNDFGALLEAFTKQEGNLSENLFSENGIKVYQSLMKYGNAKLIKDENLVLYEHDGKSFIRGFEYLFSFAGNKKFVETLTLEINEDGKVDNINFGLSETALKSIDDRPWDDSFKYTIIHFLESYKTAYALKRLDYIKSIFADDAVIITGYLVEVEPVSDLYTTNKIVKYNKYSKEEFIEKLNYSFSSKEFINLKFEESNVLQSGINEKQFGIQIKQNYFSSNYGDQGYLFLLVEFDETNRPTIHVRTWQPEQNEDGSIYGLADF